MGDGRSLPGAKILTAHAQCHDLVCNCSRDVPRYAKGSGCSCRTREKFAHADRQLVADILAEYRTDLDKEACDSCVNCNELVMCNFHSVLSLLQGHSMTTRQIERLQAKGESDVDTTR